jgi:hypothetical protein
MMNRKINRRIMKKRYIIIALICITTIFAVLYSLESQTTKNHTQKSSNIEFSPVTNIDSDIISAIQNHINKECNTPIDEIQILSSFRLADDKIYTLAQFNYSQDNSTDKAVKIIYINRNNSSYTPESYSADYLLETSQSPESERPPYIQLVMPPVERNIYFVVTRIFDSSYSAYYSGKKLAVNTDGIAAICVKSDAAPSPDIVEVKKK